MVIYDLFEEVRHVLAMTISHFPVNANVIRSHYVLMVKVSN